MSIGCFWSFTIFEVDGGNVVLYSEIFDMKH